MQDTSKYQAFAKEKIGHSFNDVQLLITALTHRSYMNEHKKSASEHNERLEFLGDAVLELAVTEHLYRTYSEPEGILTNWRAALVRTESIAAAGARLGLYELMRLSRGEKQGSERAKHQIIANAFEALIGAIYLDKGYDGARDFVNKNILVTFEDILATGSWRDAKSRLQEVAQSVDGQTPIYKVLAEVGPDHDKIFTLGAFIKGKLRGKGSGPSKQIAQQEAAKAALTSYRSEK